MKTNLKSLTAALLLTLATASAFANPNEKHDYWAYADQGFNFKSCLKDIKEIPDVEIIELRPGNETYKLSTTRDGITQVKMLECIGGAEAAQYPAHW